MLGLVPTRIDNQVRIVAIRNHIPEQHLASGTGTFSDSPLTFGPCSSNSHRLKPPLIIPARSADHHNDLLHEEAVASAEYMEELLVVAAPAPALVEAALA